MLFKRCVTRYELDSRLAEVSNAGSGRHPSTCSRDGSIRITRRTGGGTYKVKDKDNWLTVEHQQLTLRGGRQPKVKVKESGRRVKGSDVDQQEGDKRIRVPYRSSPSTTATPTPTKTTPVTSSIALSNVIDEI